MQEFLTRAYAPSRQKRIGVYLAEKALGILKTNKNLPAPLERGCCCYERQGKVRENRGKVGVRGERSESNDANETRFIEKARNEFRKQRYKAMIKHITFCWRHHFVRPPTFCSS